MNTIEKFLMDLLKSQELTPEQEKCLQEHKKEITDFLRKEFGADPIIKYAGSQAKGAMNQDSYDLDIVCYFPSSDTRTLKEIRDDVTAHLSNIYLLQHKASAERILNLKGSSTPSSYHIDVVPGRFIEGSSDVFLNVNDGDKERLQTNLKTHIDYIVNSGCVPIIRLLKIWRHRNNVPIKTFVLELFVIKALEGFRNKSDLQKSFEKVLEELKDNFGKVELKDPANTNNIVSRTIDSAEKALVTHIAVHSFNKISGSDDVEDWKEIFHERDSKETSPTHRPHINKPEPAVVGAFTPRSPWCM